MKEEDFIREFIELINMTNNFKETFEEKFDQVPKDLFLELATLSQEFTIDAINEQEESLIEMFKEYDVKDLKIYLAQNEYDDFKTYIKNIDSFDIQIGEILDFEKIEDFSKFSIRKQIFAIERMVDNLKNNLESINEIIENESNLNINR